jgi:REP element-mobilizing transposase RayT
VIIFSFPKSEKLLSKTLCYINANFLEGIYMRQLSLGFLNDYKKEFGGSLLIGKRKTARPISVKKPMHLILKTTKLSPFNPTNYKLEKIIKQYALRYKITVYDFSLNWSHIHLTIKLPNRAAYFAFIKTVTAALINHLSKTLGKNLKGLFDLRPYTKIITCKKQFESAIAYMDLNLPEALGIIKRVKKTLKRVIRGKSEVRAT